MHRGALGKLGVRWESPEIKGLISVVPPDGPRARGPSFEISRI